MISNISLKNVLPRVFAGSERELPVKDSQVWLRELDFTAPNSYLIEAESGTGKSSLCSYIYGNRHDYSGEILFDGENIRTFSISQWCELRTRAIALLPQEMRLFPELTVKENILMGNPDATDEQVYAAAKAANAHDFIINLPEGYDTKVGERGVKLSGGQKQRIAIARVFLKNPSILVLDEATSALDLESEALIQDSLERLASERTTIIIAHRLSTITHADNIFVIEHGQVVENGTHAELMEKQGSYYNLFQVQKLN